MKLKYQEQIEAIENCPMGDLKGDILLYRCVENPMSSASFEPHGVIHKPKYQNQCLAWGLSMFRDFKSAKETLKSLSSKKKQKVKFESIASGMITDKDGVKHNSKNKKHYTFYPQSEIDLTEKFVIVNGSEK